MEVKKHLDSRSRAVLELMMDILFFIDTKEEMAQKDQKYLKFPTYANKYYWVGV